MESAIPVHLRCPRLRNKAVNDDFTPPFPAMIGRFPTNVERAVMANIGIQYLTGPKPEQVLLAQHCLESALGATHGPAYWDRSVYVDSQGHTNEVVIAYWTDTKAYAAWANQYMNDWVNGAFSSTNIGTYLEVLTPDIKRLETLFSSDSLEGIASTGNGLSAPIQEHSYWGSMRDRIPLSQTEAITSAGIPSVITDGFYQKVEPHENLCLIRSGQDWSDTRDEERRIYLEDVEPVLERGMTFLSDKGREVGCFSNRYMRIMDSDGQLTDRSFGISYWRDMADLELWAKSHPTHQAIFGSAMKYLGTYGPEAKLKLYHEVMVLSSTEQSYEYYNCHSGTGMLGLS